ncbi:MAG: sialate O-acetylesterase [Bacteroidetes bacterium]|nr:MAG: sialate O-acetylesterase [Bacteroidota bacterium]
MRKLALVFVYAVLVHGARGQVRLPKLISDGMVLQRARPLRIWGWASPGEKIVLRFIGKSYTAVAQNDSSWLIEIAACREGGPFEMKIDASNHITVRDILIGDVWLCSGQSNMVLPMQRVKDRYPNDIRASGNDSIRQFLVPVRYIFTHRARDLESGSWQSANPKSVLQFTATGYFFAKALFDKYHVPIGLINSSAGGAPAESWLSLETLQYFPQALAMAKKCMDSNYVDSIIHHDEMADIAWHRELYIKDTGMREPVRWYDTNYNASNWKTMNIPGFWRDQGLPPVNGVVWFRKEIQVPASLAGLPAKLWLGTIVDRDSTYINGQFVGTIGYQYPPRKYEIPAGFLHAGSNIIVVRVINQIGNGGFNKGKPYQLMIAGHVIDLKGPWQFRLGTSMPPLPGQTFFSYKPLGLFNGMISPLVNYRIKGVIWYQGEANTSRASKYASVFSALINNWRKEWQQGDFPFLFVQLPNFMPPKTEPSESEWAELRASQLRSLEVANTAMVVTIDVGEWNDLHPTDKKTVGTRLALAARHVAYGENALEYSGPIYESSVIRGNRIYLHFTHTGSGLMAKEGKPLKYFSIAGDDKKYVWANAKIEGDTVIVWNDEVEKPVSVRYAWADNPEGANLYNKEGLPASTFTTTND